MKIKNFLYASALAAVSLTAGAQEPVDYVNTFIGGAANGHTFPGACVPFGMVQTSPTTGATGWQYCAEYLNSDTRIWGFSQTHLNGTGCLDLGDILVMPSTARQNRKDYRSDFKKSTESAFPGYYTVYLEEPGVKAELTATPHVAFHRYTYEKTDSAALYVDLQHGATWNQKIYDEHILECEVNWENTRTISGHYRTNVWVDRDVYFVMTFDRDMKGMRDLPAAHPANRGDRMLIDFDMKKGEQLNVKIALSSTSIAGAHKNLEAELAGWDFDGTVQAAKKQWNGLLSNIQIEGTKDEKTNFYTAFYHTLIQPNNIADVDGSYVGKDGKIMKADDGKFYSTFSCWDTYRAAHPFYTLAVPEMVNPMVRSLLKQYDIQGHLPIWVLWGKENYCMIGNHSVSIIAEAYHKGFRDYDVEHAFEAMKTTQTVNHPLKSEWDVYLKYGYLPTDLIKAESVSSTLEFVYDDYAVYDMAKLMDKKEDAKEFERRSNFYKNLFDTTSGFMRPRNSDGSWKSPFNPSGLAHFESSGGDYTEGNAWQYTWHVQHDVPGLIKLMGGKNKFTTKLDSLFTIELKGEKLADVTGLIGQYAHGNEPSHHVAYLYTLAGEPARTQELVRQIIETQYLPTPEGLCGNDDCGQMSAWYMLSCMGFYPVNPVAGEYVFGAPQLPSMTLNLPMDKKFVITAENLSKENKYVKAIYLNGKKYKKNFIKHEDIVKGGKLKFVMTNKRP